MSFPLRARDRKRGFTLIELFWGVHPAGGTGILAYSKGTDASGGWVLLQNGTVQQMTAGEFKATPKAK
jgi:hypothetical protein